MKWNALDVDLIRRRVIGGALLVTLPALAILYMMAARFDGLIEQKALHYAQVARNLASGQGFTTSVITPFGLSQTPQLNDHPDLWCAPMYVFWQTTAYRAVWSSDRVSALASGGAWVLLLWASFFIALRRYGTRPAWLTFFLLLINPYLLHFGISGLPHPLAALFLLVFLDRLVPSLTEQIKSAGKPKKFPWPELTITSLAGALALLTNYDLALPVAASLIAYWSLWPSQQGVNQPLLYPDEVHLTGDRVRTWLEQRIAPRIVLASLSLLLLMTSPWWIRNIVVTGHPLYSFHAVELLANTSTYPGQSVFRLFSELIPSPFLFLITHIPEMLWKTVAGLARSSLDLLNQLNAALMALILIGILRPPNDQQHVKLMRYWLLVSLLFLISIAMHDGDFRAFSIVIPVLTIIAAGEFYLWQGTNLDPVTPKPPRGDEPGLWASINLRSPRRLIGLLIALFAILQWAVQQESRAKNLRLEVSSNIPWLTDRTPVENAVLSASPWTMTWQGGVKSVWMPEDQISLRNMLRIHGEKILWMYFPRQRPIPPAPDPVPSLWFDLIRSPDSEPGYVEIPSLSRREALRQRASLISSPAPAATETEKDPSTESP